MHSEVNELYIGVSHPNDRVRNRAELVLSEFGIGCKLYDNNEPLVNDLISQKEDFSNVILHDSCKGMSGIAACKELLKNGYGEERISILAERRGMRNIAERYFRNLISLRPSSFSGVDTEEISKHVKRKYVD